MKDDELLKIINQTLEESEQKYRTNADEVFKAVKKIMDLPDGTKTSISELLDGHAEFDTYFYVDDVCQKIGITLDSEKHDGMGPAYVGLPNVIRFIIKKNK